MKNSLLSFGVLLLTTATVQQAQAQLSVGPRFSLQNTWGRHEVAEPYYSTASGHRRGFQAGLLLNIPCSPKVAVQPSLLYSRRFFQVEKRMDNRTGYSELGLAARVNYLELPVNLVYTVGGTKGLQVFAGPYAALGLGGEATPSEFYFSVWEGLGSSETTGLTFARQQGANTRNTTYLRRFDAGVQSGIGYRLGSVQAQLSYSHGFFNRLPRTQDGATAPDKVYHQALQLSVGYLLGGKAS